jgi:hypothetical protein
MKGILAGPVDGPAKLATIYPEVEATQGLAVTHRASGFRGTVVRLEAGGVELRRDSRGCSARPRVRSPSMVGP